MKLNENRATINKLILKRVDTKSQIQAEFEAIKDILEETGLLSAETKAAIKPDALSGMGAMAMIPSMLSKIAPLKECLPHIQTIMSLSAQYTETLEIQLDTVTMLLLEEL